MKIFNNNRPQIIVIWNTWLSMHTSDTQTIPNNVRFQFSSSIFSGWNLKFWFQTGPLHTSIIVLSLRMLSVTQCLRRGIKIRETTFQISPCISQLKILCQMALGFLFFLLFLEIKIKRIAYLTFQLQIPILEQNLDILSAKIIILNQEAREIYLSHNVNLSKSYQCHIFFHSPPFGDYCALITYVFLPDWREGCLRNTAKLHS